MDRCVGPALAAARPGHRPRRPDLAGARADLLGQLLILSLRERVSVPHADLKRAWAHFALPAVSMPRPRPPVDAFRKATPKHLKGRHAFMPYKGGARLADDQLAAVVLVESDDETGRVDKRHRNLGVLYLTADQGLTYESDYKPTPEVSQFVAQIHDEYTRYLTNVDGPQVRHLLSRLLQAVSSLTYHSGVYLIPAAHMGTANAIADLVRWLSAYAPAPNDVFQIPYLDTPDARHDVKQVLREHLRSEAGRILQAAQDFVDGGGTLTKTVGGKNTGLSLLQDLAALDAMLRDHERSLAETQTELQLFLGAKRQLVGRLLGPTRLHARPVPHGAIDDGGPDAIAGR